MKISIFYKTLLAAVAAGLLISVAPTSTEAQGRYVGQYSRANVDQIIRSLENSGDEFRNNFRREIDRSNLNNTQKNTYRRQVDNFENATDRLRSQFDRDDNWWTSRTQVQNVVASARPINNTMNTLSFRRNIEREWNQLRNSVNTLADTFDLPGIAGGGWSGGGDWNQWGGQTINPPAWARGTFYGQAPNGSQIILTISNNGSVTANIGGGMSYGRFTRGNNLYINGATSRVTQQSNGIRTTSNTDGLSINYSRSGWGGGGGGDWNQSGGQTINPPSWARGTFYGVAPNGSQITLTIANNGSVTANIGGTTSYGRFTRGNNLYINGATSRVTREGNGIRTTSTTDGLSINYSRSGWGSGGGGGDWNNPGTSRPPSWATGTFYGRAPNGTQITLSINADGSVTSNVGGSMNYGRYNNGMLTINESSARVTQIRNGIRTTSTSDGMAIDYRRN